MRTAFAPVLLAAAGLAALTGCTGSTSAVNDTAAATTASPTPTTAATRELTTVRACVNFLKTTSVITGQAGISNDPSAWDELVRRLQAVSAGLIEPQSVEQVDAMVTAASTISEQLKSGRDDVTVNSLVVKYWNPPALAWEQDCTKRGAHMVPALQ